MIEVCKRIKSQTLREQICRREFLTTASAMVIGGSWTASQILTGCTTNTSNNLGKIGIQLYTLRNEIEKDISGTLRRLAEVGFAGVETAFWPEGMKVKDAAKLLNDAGLAVCSSHCEIPVGEKKSQMLEIAEAFQCSKMIWHGWPEDERYKTLDGIKLLAEIYNESNHFAKSNGLQFGIHNHWWEFKNMIDGRFAYEVLLDYLEKDVFFEIDTYWVKVAGHDPAEIVAKFGRRAPCLHIKDGPARWTESIATDPEPMVAVGSGTQNFPAVVKAANGYTEWMIVEMDNVATDVFSAIHESYRYLTENKLVQLPGT